jgi:hypothetical protein
MSFVKQVLKALPMFAVGYFIMRNLETRAPAPVASIVRKVAGSG